METPLCEGAVVQLSIRHFLGALQWGGAALASALLQSLVSSGLVCCPPWAIHSQADPPLWLPLLVHDAVGPVFILPLAMEAEEEKQEQQEDAARGDPARV